MVMNDGDDGGELNELIRVDDGVGLCRLCVVVAVAPLESLDLPSSIPQTALQPGTWQGCQNATTMNVKVKQLE